MKQPLRRYVQHLLRLTTFLMLLISSATTFALTINQLQAQQTLSIETWLSTKSGSNQNSKLSLTEERLSVAVGEQVTLNIKLGTNRWFTRGTQIPNIELPNIMSRQREQFAINSTQKIKGETWSFQLWQISLLPQQSGRYEVPALGITIETMTANNGKVSGKIISQAQQFDVILPDARLVDNNWFSAAQVDVQQQWHQSNATLHVGDSITRSITTSAADTLSVLLPKGLQQTSNKQFQVYDQPIQLQDIEQRGQSLAKRTDKQVYILQQGGEMVFPDVVIRWWDTESQQLKTHLLVGNTVLVKHTLSSWLHHYRIALIIISTMLLCLFSLSLIAIKYYQKHPKPIWWLYINAVNTKRWPQVRRLLYKKVRQSNQQLSLSHGIKATHQRHAVNVQQQGNAQKQSDTLSNKDAYQLWFEVADNPPRYTMSLLKRGLMRLLPPALPQLRKKLTKLKRCK